MRFIWVFGENFILLIVKGNDVIVVKVFLISCWCFDINFCDICILYVCDGVCGFFLVIFIVFYMIKINVRILVIGWRYFGSNSIIFFCY